MFLHVLTRSTHLHILPPKHQKWMHRSLTALLYKRPCGSLPETLLKLHTGALNVQQYSVLFERSGDLISRGISPSGLLSDPSSRVLNFSTVYQTSSPILTRFLSSTLLPFLVQGPPMKNEYQEKGYPYYKGVTQEPGQSSRPLYQTLRVHVHKSYIGSTLTPRYLKGTLKGTHTVSWFLILIALKVSLNGQAQGYLAILLQNLVGSLSNPIVSLGLTPLQNLQSYQLSR